MRTLPDLLADAAGRELLLESGIHGDPATFLAALATPARRADGAADAPCPIHVHQQPSPDYRRSVVAKLAAAESLRRDRPGCVSVTFVLIDTDRAASSKAATRIAWRDAHGHRRMLKVTPAGTDALEFRHLLVEPPRLARIAAMLEAHVRQSPGDRAAALARLELVRPLLAPAEPMTLGRYAATLGGFLLDAHLGARPRPLMVSGLADAGALGPALSAIMAALDAFVAAFNARVAALQAADVATAVAALPDDYLPLFYSCPVDGARLRLRRRRIGGDLHAVAESRAGRRYAFPLGDRGTSLDALFAAGRWSPDVTLPILLNDRFSGMVAGRSSALYCMVLGATMRTVLTMKPIPVFAPAIPPADAARPDGLLQAWLTG